MSAINRLSAKQVINLPMGLHSDGGNLYLTVRAGGSRQWVMRYRAGGRQRELGLGGAGPGGMPLAEARTRADQVRRQLRCGIDPLAQKAEPAKVAAVPLFRAEMEEYIARAEPSWKNPKSAAQWRASLETHAAKLFEKPVDGITVRDLIAVLDPIWYRLPETAKRVRGHVEAILSLSKTKGHRSGENPAAWRHNLANVFAATPALVHGHFASMDYARIPGFVRELRLRRSVSALALEWIILTASRATVGVTATWAEIDLDKRLWTIKAARMKNEKNAAAILEDHVVPLSDRAFAILDEVANLRLNGKSGELLFPNEALRPLSLTSLDHCRERMGVTTTTHGFRSSSATMVEMAPPTVKAAGIVGIFRQKIRVDAVQPACGEMAEKSFSMRDPCFVLVATIELQHDILHCSSPSFILIKMKEDARTKFIALNWRINDVDLARREMTALVHTLGARAALQIGLVWQLHRLSLLTG